MSAHVGIVVHSLTGNTLSVAHQLRDSLLGAGHQVTLHHLAVTGDDPSSPGPIKLGTLPDPTGYDLLVLAGPVRGFSLSPAMRTYLESTPRLNSGAVACFVTEYFPFPWMGGNRALDQFAQLVAQRGGDVVLRAVVNWSSRKRDRLIADLVSRFTTQAGSIH